ncbi:plasmid segregation oscillating ATPase ParF (plasmid) [Thalassoporum mexicanum PCC 7367]|uniref:ParA family protein n=1 Tax=Thalassoporum mexicanum TaxID=3457544 RepID=UPI00029F8CD9|nr:ParA family protein [Pseudanabaena sp. PCC 7367]AFY71892.1 plasmid segregation oscillating ATPase ParF [Pseudanabaena sp. PCC 7367]
MIVTLLSYKGGVGKTLSAIHLAAYLAGQNATALIDGDRNRSATKWAKRGELPYPVVDEKAAAKYARNYEHLVIDTQARPNPEDLGALADVSDLVIVPTPPTAMALDATFLTLDALNSINCQNFKILLTLIPPYPSTDGKDARERLQELKLPVFAGEIRRMAVYQKAELAGALVNKVSDRRANMAWRDYQSIGSEIIDG